MSGSGLSYFIFSFSNTLWALAGKLLMFRPCLCEQSLNKPSPACLCNVPVNSGFIRTSRGFLCCVLARSDEQKRPLLALFISRFPLLHLCFGEGFWSLLAMNCDGCQQFSDPSLCLIDIQVLGMVKKLENLSGLWFIGLGLEFSRFILSFV